MVTATGSIPIVDLYAFTREQPHASQLCYCNLFDSLERLTGDHHWSIMYTVLTLKYGAILLNASVACALRQNARVILTATTSV